MNLLVKKIISLVFLFYFPSLIWAQDYYKILGVNRDANEKQIKSAYRQLSKKWHPDKNPNDEEAHHKFIEIGEAYEVLSDPEKRAVFDKYGADGLKNGAGGGAGDFQGGNMFHDPFDIFEQMFGGTGNGARGAQRRRGNDLIAEHHMPLKDFYLGIKQDVTLSLNDICDHCHGSGSEDGKVIMCPDCQGRGVQIQIIQMGIMTQQIQSMCGRCGGTGKIIKNACKVCKGAKVTKKNKVFHLKTNGGIKRNHKVRMEGEAEKSPDFDTPGDLYFIFKENELNNLGYRRRGDDLYRTEVITFNESIYGGWERTIEFLDPQKQVNLKRDVNKITLNGEIEKIPNFGMPREGKKGFGDLYVEYAVIAPAYNKAGTTDRRKIKDEL